MHISLEGRTAVVTGGSKGIGLAIASRFAAAGADIAILSRNENDLIEAAEAISKAGSGRVAYFVCDVTVPDKIERTVDAIDRTFGKIDILVNNAGASRIGPFEDLSDDVLQADLDLKLFAAIRFTRLVWPKMKERRWGRVINVLSLHAKVQNPGTAPTAISRAAGMALTKILAGEGAPYNILVNALLVGAVKSNQWRKTHARLQDGRSFDEFAKETGARFPLGRMGEADEFARMACFLASDAGSYITGTAINVDGGQSPVV